MNLRHLAPKASALPTAPHLDRLLFLETKIIKALLWSPSCGARNAYARFVLRRISTAAPFRAPCIRHRRRSHSKPKASALPTAPHLVMWENGQRPFSRGGNTVRDCLYLGAAPCATPRYATSALYYTLPAKSRESRRHALSSCNPRRGLV